MIVPAVTGEPQLRWTREDLVADERGRGFPAVVRFGPYLFVSGSDGHRNLDDEQIDPALADDAIQQCRNSYGRVAMRLERAGYGGDCAVWIENFTSGQHWRLERMGLWPEYFGEENHMKAVSFGAQTRHSGINMMTCTVMAIDPRVPRTVAVAPPGRGRASRITRVGKLVFVIGVRGHLDVETAALAPEETADAFGIQLDYCVKALDAHLKKDGTPLDNLVRVDGALRAARFIAPYEAGLRRHFDGRIPFASYAVGTPLGARCEQEIGGIAIAAGEMKQVCWSTADPSVADAVTAAGLVFLRSFSGLLDEASGTVLSELRENGKGQARQAIKNILQALARVGTGPQNLLRMEVFLKDIYAQDEVLAELVQVLGEHLPALSFIGCEPRHGAEVEISAIAGMV